MSDTSATDGSVPRAWSVLLTFAAVHAAFFPSTRYRAPVEFVLLFYAGVAVAAIAVKNCASGGGAPGEAGIS